MAWPPFHFKKFSVEQAGAAHPVGTDGVLLGVWADVQDCQNILDIGTGTGLLALMLAQRTVSKKEACKILAVEIHPASAELARRNFAASPWAGRLEAVEASIQHFAQNTDTQFDLIVSNPPFFSEKTVSPNALRRLGRHTDSLQPGELLSVSKKLLKPGGRLCVILPVLEGKRFCELAVSSGLYCTEEVAVHARPQKPAERLLLRLERDPRRFARGRLSIYADESGKEYSSDFQKRVEGFYLQ